MRFSDSQLAAFGILSHGFVEEFRRRFTSGSFSEVFSDRPEIHIPCGSQSVGNLIVYLDGDEVTVEVGELYHTHFSFWHYGSILDEQSVGGTVNASLEFIRQVLADEIVFRLFYRDGRVAGATTLHYPTIAVVGKLSELDGLPFRDFRWSGPIQSPME